VVGRASRVAPRNQLAGYRELEAGERSPSFETWDGATRGGPVTPVDAPLGDPELDLTASRTMESIRSRAYQDPEGHRGASVR
jgi:hypothetical protein